jgi:hypothetical protein
MSHWVSRVAAAMLDDAQQHDCVHCVRWHVTCGMSSVGGGSSRRKAGQAGR